MSRLSAIVLTAVLAFYSAIELVIHRHESRRLFVELQELRRAEQNLNREWGQLLLEQATWGTHSRVEELAAQELGMTVPDGRRVVELR